MASVIKAADRNRAGAGVAFNFDDVRTNAEAYLAKVREQAVELIVAAQRESAAIRQRAEAAGRQAAEQAADAQLDQKLAEQMTTVLPALQAAVHEISQSRPGWLAHWEQRAVHLACAIAGRVIRREIANEPTVTLHLVREALELSSGRADVRILLNPTDHAALRDQVATIAAEVSRLAPAEVLADVSIAPGGCRVETCHGSIDQQFEAQLARIEEELT